MAFGEERAGVRVACGAQRVRILSRRVRIRWQRQLYRFDCRQPSRKACTASFFVVEQEESFISRARKRPNETRSLSPSGATAANFRERGNATSTACGDLRSSKLRDEVSVIDLESRATAQSHLELWRVRRLCEAMRALSIRIRLRHTSYQEECRVVARKIARETFTATFLAYTFLQVGQSPQQAVRDDSRA